LALFNQTQSPITVMISSAPPQGATEAVVTARQIGVTGGALPSASSSARVSEPLPRASELPSGTASQPEPSAGASEPSPGASEPSPGASEPAAGASEPAPSESAGAADLQPARFTIPPHGAQSFMPGDPQSLQAVGLSGPLASGTALAVTIESSATNQPMQLFAPVAIPLSPAPRAPGASNEVEEGEND
jgi:hypothetical protein